MQRRTLLKVIGAAMALPGMAIAGLVVSREKRMSSLVVYHSPSARSSIVVGGDADDVIRFARLCGTDPVDGVVRMIAAQHGVVALYIPDRNYEMTAEAKREVEVYVSREIVVGLADAMNTYKSCNWVWEKRRAAIA